MQRCFRSDRRVPLWGQRLFSSTSTKAQQATGLHVQLDPLDGNIFCLSLTRPDAKNAIGRQLLKELREAFANLRREHTTRCLVLKSAVPGAFCAGADLKERIRMTQQDVAAFVSDLRAAMEELQALPMPTIAVVDGVALGGGAELALACDLRVAGPSTVFGFPETRLGIIPGAGGTQRLPRIVGRTAAKELIFTGRRINGTDALRLGLVDHLAAEGESAESRALQLARDIAQGAPIALRMAKAAIDSGLDVDSASGLRMEQAYYAQVIPTEDRMEGLRAFAEKRQPEFKGR